jgi:hypothetical protein
MRALRFPLALAFSSLLAVGCSSGTGGGGVNTAFKLKNTSHGVAASTPLLADGNLLAYLASEASSGATDLNGDGDMIDPVAVRVHTITNKVDVLGVATQSMVFLNRTLFLVVSEAADGTDWTGDADTVDRVLLYVESDATTPTFLAELDGSVTTAMALVGDRLLFVGSTAPVAQLSTNLFSTAVATKGAAPDTPIAVTSTINDANSDGISFSIWTVVDDMAFLTMDETVDGELNGDSDALDTAVLALIDAGDISAQVASTALAVDLTGDVDALAGGNDWMVAFLVDEADQGTNLNDPTLFDASWQPGNCSGVADADMTDNVLHWLLYSDFLTNANVVNTGLVGSLGATEYVYVHKNDYVGVVSLESDEGSGSGCDLNGDGDFADRIFRWVDASNPSAPALPVTNENKLLAVADNVPGSGGDSTGGVLTLGPLWIMLVDEAADGRSYDGDSGTDNLLVGAHNPNNVGQNWNFNHGSTNPGPVSVSWMSEDPRDPDRFLAGMTEDVVNIDLNNDGDKADSVPTFPVRLSGDVLKFPGFGIAVDANDAGVVVAGGIGFYRVSEFEEDSTDLNGDGDTNDFLLQRIGLTTNDLPTFMGTLNSLSGPAIAVKSEGDVSFAALLFEESLVGPGGSDLNNDGDANDLVVRYFRMP